MILQIIFAYNIEILKYRNWSCK